MAAAKTCLRRLAASEPCRSIARSSAQAVQRRCFHTPAPLYLDFLAPSWRTKRPLQPQCRASKTSVQPSRLSPHRALSTTTRRQATAIKNPRNDDDGNPMTIHISPRAAHRLQTIAQKDSNPDLVLRVSVESGGCHGFQYLMSLTNTSEIDPTEDTLFENEEVIGGKGGGYKAKIVMDEPSLELLKGSTVDYTMELIGSQFKVTGIPGATSSCGCGTSFDIAA